MKVFLDTIGCRLNQAEIELMARQFRAAGHEIVDVADAADLAVINTCAVTAQAESDSRAGIRRAARAGAAQIVATGCWATLRPEAAMELPQVSRVVPNSSKDALVPGLLDLRERDSELEPLAREPLPGAHRRTRAFIKVQDGCNNRCTFCITTVARGSSRSWQIESVLADVHAAVRGGAREVVLTGVHLGSWGKDAGSSLGRLVRAVLQDTNVPRLRLSSLEPWDLSAEFFRLWESPRLCRHLHLPLQSGSAATLRRMARMATPESFRALVGSAREMVPDMAVTTDVISGFPGESEEHHRASVDYVRSLGLAGGHAFTYSPRPGTVAARMSDQIPAAVRRQRTHDYIDVFASAAFDYRRKQVGATGSVLWESATPSTDGTWRLEGLSDNYLRVTATSASQRWNQIDQVEYTGIGSDSLRGIIRDSG